MVPVVAHQTNVAHFCSHFDGGWSPLHLQVFHHLHRVAILQNISCCVSNFRWADIFCVFSSNTHRPFMRAFWARKHFTEFVGVFARTLWAWRQCGHRPQYPDIYWAIVLKSSERGNDSIAFIRFSGGAIILRVAKSKNATRLEILHASFPFSLMN